MLPLSRSLPTLICAGLIASPGLLPTSSSATPASWADPTWEYRIPISVKPDSIQGTGEFHDFPLLLSLDGIHHAAVFNSAKADGSDLLVTGGDGVTVLSREVVGYNREARTAEVWVRVEALSRTQNGLYLYYGNPDTTLSEPPSAAWSEEFRAVYHFADDPGAGVLSDSSPQHADAVLDPARQWTSSDTTEAQIHQGWLFNGTTHHISTQGISTQDSCYAISAWLLNTTRGVDFALQASPGYWHISSQRNASAPLPDFARQEVSVRFHPNPIPLDARYHHFAWVFDGVQDTLIFYFDGVPQAVHSTYPMDPPAFYTGQPINPLQDRPVGVLGPMWFNNEDLMTGGGDEFHLREGALSADWIKTEYRNQRDPIGFFVFGSEETRETSAADLIAGASTNTLTCHPNPFNAHATITLTLESSSRVRLSVFSVSGQEVARLIDRVLTAGSHSAPWDGKTRQGQDAPSGVYIARLESPAATRSVKLLLQR